MIARTPDVIAEQCAACLGRDPACDICGGTGKVRRRIRAARRATSRPVSARTASGEPTPIAEGRAGAVLVLLTKPQKEAFREIAAEELLGVGPWLRALGMRELKKRRKAG